MVPLHLFRSRNFTGANLLTLFLYTALSGVLFFFPLNLIQVQGYSATEAGAALLPFILLMFLLSRWSGGLVERYGAKRPLVIGPLIAAQDSRCLRGPASAVPTGATFFPAVVILGLGMAISVAPLTTTVMNCRTERPRRCRVGYQQCRLTSRRRVLSVAVFGLILSSVFNRVLDRRLSNLDLRPAARERIHSQRDKLAAIETTDPRERQAVDESFVAGYRDVLWIAFALAIASSVSAVVLIGDRDTGIAE